MYKPLKVVRDLKKLVSSSRLLVFVLAAFLGAEDDDSQRNRQSEAN